MNIAKFNERITVEKSTVEVDGAGNHLLVWSPYYSCAAYASAVIFKDAESEKAGVTVSDETIVFTVRYCSEIAAVTVGGYRILFRGEPYNIDSVDHMNYDKKSVKLRCKKEHRNGEKRGGKWAGR